MTDVIAASKERVAEREERRSRPTVYEAVAAVIAELPGIGKDQVQKSEGYSFRGIETITRHLQPLLAKHGVVIVPNATVVNVTASPAMNPGWQDVYVRVEWTVYGPDGSKLTAVTNGIGRDKSDKGANKAQTQAFKYLLLHLLCIADAADDTDAHSYEEGRAAGPTAARDAHARELGWTGGLAEQHRRFAQLRDDTNTAAAAAGNLDTVGAAAVDAVKAWAKAEHITRDGLTPEHAFVWQSKLNEIAAGAEPASPPGEDKEVASPGVPVDEHGDPL